MPVDIGSVTVGADGTGTGSGLTLALYNAQRAAYESETVQEFRKLAWPGYARVASAIATELASYYTTITVSPNGGQFSTIAAACASITDAATDNRYVIRVAAGTYGGFTIPDYVDVIGESRHSCMISEGSTSGAVQMGNETLLSDFLILNSTGASDWGIVSNNKTGVQIRHVDILGDMYEGPPPTQVMQGIKVTGDSWMTLFISDCIINYLGTTGWGIYLAGNSTTPQLCDTHIENSFVDAFFATTGGAVKIKDLWGTRIRGGLYRTTTTGRCLELEATGTPPGNPVDAMLEGGVTFESPMGTNTNTVLVNSYCGLLKKSATCDFINQPGTKSYVLDYQRQWLPMPAMGDFAWTNQGDTECTLMAHGGWVMRQPKTRTNITVPYLGILRMDVPGSVYTFTARITPCTIAKPLVRCGLCWRDDSSGKIIVVEICGTAANVHYLAVTKFSNTMTLDAYYYAQPFPVTGPVWIRIGDTGSLLQVFISPDGSDWQGIFEVANDDYCTPDQIGLFVDAENDATPDMDAQMLIDAISWTTG